MRRYARNHANVARWLNSLRFIGVAPTLFVNDAVAPTGSAVSPLDLFYPTPSRCPSLMQKGNVEQRALSWTGAMQMRGFHAALEQQQEMKEETATANRPLRTTRDYSRFMLRLLLDRSYDRVPDLFEKMKSNKIPTDSRIYTSVMRAYARLNNIEMVQRVFDEFLATGSKPDAFMMNTLIFAYSNTGDIKAAFETCRKMEEEYELEANQVTYRSLIIVCNKGKDVDRARKTFDDAMEEFEEKDIRTYNVMLETYAENADSDTGETYLQECKDLLVMLKENEIRPEAFTYMPLIKLCGKMGLKEEMMEYLKESISNDAELSLPAFVALFRLMADLELSDKELEDHLLLCFKRMNELTMKPFGITYRSILDLYEKKGDVRQAHGFFTKMAENDMAHFSSGAKCFAAQIEIVERLFTNGTYSKEEALTKLTEVLGKLAFSKTSLTYHGYRQWLAICIRASDVDRAFECWNALTKRDRRPPADIAESMIRLTLDHDRVDDAVELLKSVQKDRKVLPTEGTYEAILAYCVQKSDTENAKKTHEYMKEAEVEPTKEIQAHLDALQLV